MTLWNSEQEMANFVRSPAHREAMKGSASLAMEIRLHTYEGTWLPDWPEAIGLLEQGKVLRYG